MYKLYLIDPSLDIKYEMLHTALANLTLKSISGSIFGHSINSQIGFKTVAAVQQTIKHSQERNLSWKTKERVDVMSSVLCF